MKNKFLLGAAFLSAGAIVWAATDPVIMTVNGVDVPKSEFEYLYQKNSQQQIEAQPLEEYVGMFELYKMKVADAKAEGIDTTAAFISEMKQYRDELAAPYLADSVYLNQLIDETYQNSLEEVEANHIMVAKGRNSEENKKARQRIDSIHTELLNGADFEALAKKCSDDNSAVDNGGHLGYIVVGRYPYSFEKVAFTLAPNQISEIVESPVGYHVLKGGNHRAARGMVRASHIMKLVSPGASPAEEAAAKAAIDSLYLVVCANPDSFDAVAMKNSDDTGSASRGGQLGWFGTGQMVPEFQEAAFALPVGAISEPVRSHFGWHIIKKIDERGPFSREELKQNLLQRFSNPRDERFKMIRDQQSECLAKKHKGKLNAKKIAELKEYVAANGLDSAFYKKYGTRNSDAIFTIQDKPSLVYALVETLDNTIVPDSYIASQVLEDRIDVSFNNALVDAEENWLIENNRDYKNLLNEYEEGSLLYEVSLRKVWDKAAQDQEGLTKYFNSHRDDYKWSQPKAKGILVQAKNDSVAELIKARHKELGGDTAFVTLRKEFKNDALIERVLAQKGINKHVDNLMFNGPDAEPSQIYPVIFILEPRILQAPEEMSDVKGQVTSDYQTLLEEEWVADLKRKYPVKVNEKVLKEVKKN